MLNLTARILAGWLALQQGAFPEAWRYFNSGVTLAKAMNNAAGRGNALTGMGHLSMSEGSWEQAAQLPAEGETLLRAEGVWWDLALNLNIHNTLLLLQGQAGPAGRLPHANRIFAIQDGISEFSRY